MFAGSSKVLVHEFDDTVGDDLGSIEPSVQFDGENESEMVIQDQSTAQITEIEDDEGQSNEEEIVIQKKCFHGIKIYLHRSLERNGKAKFRRDLQDCVRNFDGILVTSLGKFPISIFGISSLDFSILISVPLGTMKRQGKILLGE